MKEWFKGLMRIMRPNREGKVRALYLRPEQNTQKTNCKEPAKKWACFVCGYPLCQVSNLKSEQPTNATYRSVLYPQALQALRETSQAK